LAAPFTFFADRPVKLSLIISDGEKYGDKKSVAACRRDGGRCYRDMFIPQRRTLGGFFVTRYSRVTISIGSITASCCSTGTNCRIAAVMACDPVEGHECFNCFSLVRK
jgi:hypothetical protein